MISIPFHKPIVLNSEELKNMHNHIDDCIITGYLTNGKNVKELESRIADIYNIKHAIATSSASQGLSIALHAMYRKNKYLTKYIDTSAFAWYSTDYIIKLQARYPMYNDIDITTWNMEKCDSAFTVPIHTFGNVTESISNHTLYDGAHCLGSDIKDFGDATVLSLAPTKLITSGEGGIILTDDNVLAKYITEERDKISRMSEINAILGNIYLSYLPDILKFKQMVFKYYSKNLKGIFQKKDVSTNYNTIGMLTDLKIPNGIETKKYYSPLSGDFENTNYAYEKIICLPSYYGCDYKFITKAINEYNKY